MAALASLQGQAFKGVNIVVLAPTICICNQIDCHFND